MVATPAGGPPPRAGDDEHALRLLVRDWFRDGRVTSAAFRTPGRQGESRTAISIFIEERLPGRDGGALHVGRFASRGRARLAVRHIRSVTRSTGGVIEPAGLDVVMTGTAGPPLAAFGAAHGELQGPTNQRAVARALANAFNQQGRLEKPPD